VWFINGAGRSNTNTRVKGKKLNGYPEVSRTRSNALEIPGDMTRPARLSWYNDRPELCDEFLTGEPSNTVGAQVLWTVQPYMMSGKYANRGQFLCPESM